MKIDTWIGRADRALASAELLSQDGDFDRAASTAYYAMFYAARVALLHVGQAERAMGKTHSGMISAFNQYLIHPGLIETGYGKSFSFELNRRILADYEEGGVDRAGADEAIASARALVAEVRRVIGIADPTD